ncbi:hypothetical protein ACO2IY_19400 [Leptospira interrogans]|uniref:hypothetical protein n=1 Tax=Leptospira interrogans TaxID=173 RepID=UPI001CE42F93|nr:hypothetical protein [Leptospira interrogans]
MDKLKLISPYININTRFRRIAFSFRTQLVIGIIALCSLGIILNYSEKNNYIKLSFTLNQCLDFLNQITQLIGIITGALLAFFIFNCQSIETQRQSYYLEIIRNVDNLKNHLLNLPNKYKFIKFELALIINSFNFKTFKEIDFFDSDFDKAHREFVVKLEDNKIQYTGLLGKTRLIDDIASNILRIDDYMESLRVLEVQIILLELLVKSLKKLFITILFSMLFIYFSQILKFENIFYLLIPLLFIYLLTFSFYVLFDFIRFYYNGLSGEITKESE